MGKPSRSMQCDATAAENASRRRFSDVRSRPRRALDRAVCAARTGMNSGPDRTELRRGSHRTRCSIGDYVDGNASQFTQHSPLDASVTQTRESSRSDAASILTIDMKAALLALNYYFFHSGIFRPGVHGAPASSSFLCNFGRSSSTSVFKSPMTSSNSSPAISY